MFERFTERARTVVVTAQEKARGLKHDYIGPEHVLYGLAADEESLASRVLASLDVTPERIEDSIRQIVGVGDAEIELGPPPFTPRGKQVLERSLREALSLGHNYIGTEHILLALTREDSGVHARMFEKFGVLHENISDRVIEALSGPKPQPTSKRVAESGSILRFEGKLFEVVGIAEGRTIRMRPIGEEPCFACGSRGDRYLAEHSQSFQDNAEPVETLLDL